MHNTTRSTSKKIEIEFCLSFHIFIFLMIDIMIFKCLDLFEANIQQMISSAQKQTAFYRIPQALNRARNVQPRSLTFLDQMNHNPIRSENHLYCLYIFFKFIWNKGQYNLVKSLIINYEIIPGIVNFINYIKQRALGNSTEISDKSLEQILGLIFMTIATQLSDPQLKNIIYDFVRVILQNVYEFIQSQSRGGKLKQKLLQCLSIYRREGYIVNDLFYSTELANNTTNIDQFAYFMIDYMKRVKEKQPKVVQNILRGLTSRFSIFMSTQAYRNTLTMSLLALSSFLYKEPTDSEWLTSILQESEHSKIFDVLLEMTSKNENYMKLSDVVNKIVETYMRSQINNLTKFQFIMKIFKYIIQKSSSFYTFVKTDALAENKEFLRWFIKTELRYEKGQEIIRVYFSSSYALEFLLIVMIYYNDAFPAETEEVYAFMDSLSFLQESILFINNESVRHFLDILHMQADHQEKLNDFLNNIQGRKLNKHLC